MSMLAKACAPAVTVVLGNVTLFTYTSLDSEYYSTTMVLIEYHEPLSLERMAGKPFFMRI